MNTNAYTKKTARRLDSLAFFAVGAAAYPLVEIAWRGHSHWTMSAVGGTCVLLIHLANRRLRSRSVLLRCAAGAAIITGVEFASGMIINRLLGWNVWDYSSVPFNILGQICPLYCIFWLLLSFPVICASTWALFRRECSAIVFV